MQTQIEWLGGSAARRLGGSAARRLGGSAIITEKSFSVFVKSRFTIFPKPAITASIQADTVSAILLHIARTSASLSIKNKAPNPCEYNEAQKKYPTLENYAKKPSTAQA